MDDRRMNQLADDVHLIAAPFRLIGEWLKIILFILALPVVLLISTINWLFTGQPIMSPDEIFLAKWAFILLTPVWVMLAGIIIWRIAKHFLNRKPKSTALTPTQIEWQEKNREDMQRLDSLRRLVCPCCQKLVPDFDMYGLTEADWTRVAQYHGQSCKWTERRGRGLKFWELDVPGFPPEHPLAGKNENDYTQEQIVAICERAGYG